MSLLNFHIVSSETGSLEKIDRFERDALGDLKHGLDLIFELKKELDKMHPIASETLIRMLAH